MKNNSSDIYSLPSITLTSTAIPEHLDEEITIASYPVLQIILGTIYFIIIFLALFGNATVITAVTIIQERKSPTHWLLVSLACADLTVTVLVMPFALTYDVLGNWQYGSTFCRFWMSWDVMCCTASLQHLCAIAWDRYVAVTDPFDYPHRINLRKVIIIILLIWLNSALLSFFPIFTGLSSKATDNAEFSADSLQCFLSTNPVYAVISATISLYLPFGIMLFCYIRIFSIVWEKIKVTGEHSRRPASHIELSDGDDAVSLRTSAASGPSLKDLKATKTLGILFGVLFFCWLPFFICYWINAFTTTLLIPQPIHSMITWLGYFNSTMNPIIYSWNPVFRADYKQLFLYILSLCKERNEAEEMLRLHDLDSNGRAHLMSACSTDGQTQVLTQEDIDELEKIFWPVKKPLLDRTTTAPVRNHGSIESV
ncbi:beta-2 adrenergic receptor-like [Paramacrobiotus metropolitanus]|uniref:beta-2 adrenergic receptor-like n=1 Tax=Paramacrobiotus metropolitanus TaxID=2943436 RepID=UPI0024459A71|nr:beta-2 adrenergic receptor-like [Paramacrobiotus metropolitanus]XP_055332685.1 beta-2 adrenergic receptor-like [Paramacrobiotus metropolitanus]